LGEHLRPINAKVRDRLDLILKIFDRHAESAEAKMQVDLVAIKHMGPRIFNMGIELGRQG
jgi:50S ribosomal subunit-associated GTPase HflX